MPPGWRHVFDGVDGRDLPVSLVHEDSEPLRRMAVFDVARQQRRPQGRPRAGDGATATGTASTTASPSTSSTSSAPSSGAGSASPLPEDDLAEVLARRRRAVRPAAATCWRSTSPTRRSTPWPRRCRAAVRARRDAGPAGAWPGHPVAALLRADTRCALRLPACVRGRLPRCPTCPVTGPAVALLRHCVREPGHDHAPTARPGSTSAASRRTTPRTSATPRRTSPSTCSTGPGATPVTRCATSQNVTDVDDPLLERAAKVNVDWIELAERETELFRQDMQALRVLAARPLRRRGRVDPARRGR